MTSHANDLASRPWTGPMKKYDIIKEGTIALVVVAILVGGLTLVFGSPDDAPLTFKGWALNAGDDLYATTVMELAGTSESAGYGPPYNNASDGLHMGPLYLQKWAGVTQPIDSAKDFVINPLTESVQPADVTAALATWKGASAEQQTSWATAYDTALTDAEGDKTKVASGDYGPVPVLAQGLVNLAATGGLDSALNADADFYHVNNTAEILFMGDGGYLDAMATDRKLQGDTWGMMNEPNRYPGQAWLWLYSFWYQVPPFVDESQEPFGANADVYIMALMGVLSFGLMFIQFIPGLRRLPYLIPIHRLIWKDYYRKHGIH